MKRKIFRLVKSTFKFAQLRSMVISLFYNFSRNYVPFVLKCLLKANGNGSLFPFYDEIRQYARKKLHSFVATQSPLIRSPSSLSSIILLKQTTTPDIMEVNNNCFISISAGYKKLMVWVGGIIRAFANSYSNSSLTIKKASDICLSRFWQLINKLGIKTTETIFIMLSEMEFVCLTINRLVTTMGQQTINLLPSTKRIHLFQQCYFSGCPSIMSIHMFNYTPYPQRNQESEIEI